MIHTLASLALDSGKDIFAVESRGSYTGGMGLNDPALIRWFGGGADTWSGEYVTEQSALNCGAVYSCVRVLSEGIASLPLNVYRRLPNGDKEPAFDHPIHRLLHDEPNPEQTPFQFKEMAMANLCLWGNFYAQLVMDGKGFVRQMWPLRPDWMSVERRNGARVYIYNRADGTSREFTEFEILHIAGLGFDGLKGYSPVALQRQGIGATMAAEKFAAKLWANGVKPSGILQIPPGMGDLARKQLNESFKAAYASADNAHKTIALEEGVKWVQTTMPPNDAQFLETRKHDRSEIAGWYRVPPHFIGDLDRSTNNNIENQDLGLAKHTLNPWCVRIEERCEKALFGERERARFFCEFNMDAILRGDAKSRAEYHRSLVDGGIIMPNEARRKENWNPVPAGEVFYRPLNTAYVKPDGTVLPMVDPAAPVIAPPQDK